MIAVIFESVPRESEKEDYLKMAASLKPILEEMDGFISIERFESLATPGKLLSLSFWRDEEAVKAWRNTKQHRGAQAQGRARLFEDYRLRVAAVSRDYSRTERGEAPADSLEFHE